ncbi:MAG TPA: GMC family oxidoreductase [Gemmatimonadaceae bacterium]|nr:GMC family oxidoreductase [Gemmatimonadaceae bacterium]
MQSTTFDAIVVGSGITGGWASKELSEKGLNTLCLEAGRPINPATDYVEHVPAYEMPFRGLGDRRALERQQPIQRTCYACDEYSGKFFVNDLDNPYTTPVDKPFSWIRGRQVGGRSIAWGRQCYRWSDLDFEANAREDIGVDWPIRYRDIAPWYDYVERFVGLQGNAEGLAHLPDGQFLPPFPLNCAEARLRDAVRQRFGSERVVTNARVAILSQAHNGRQACHFCGPCERGCATFSYFNSVHVTLPAAHATGRFTLRPFSVVHSVRFDPQTRRASGVRVIDANTRQVIEYRARVVFLCASTLESARILMNSATAEFPDGLANSSGVLGRYLMDHIMGGGANGVVPWLSDRKSVGNARSGFYIPRFRNVTSRHQDFQRGYAFQGRAWRAGWDRGRSSEGFGADFKASLIRGLGPWTFRVYGFGEHLPSAENRAYLDPNVVDAWGIPALRIECRYDDNAKRMLKDMVAAASEMLAAAGATEITPIEEDNPPGLVIHEMGTARMGRDAKTSVLNGWNQAWDVPNLFVTDGACMTSNANQNPSITYMALTARAANHAVELMKRNEL